MEIVAVLADIHGNLPALEAVFRDLNKVSPDLIIVAGDMVGRGPQGNEVVKLVESKGCDVIKGNHEEYLLDIINMKLPAKWRDEPEWRAAFWMAEELDKESVSFIRALPYRLCIPFMPSFVIVHGSARSTNYGLGEWLSDLELSEHLKELDASFLVCGHTHLPMYRVTKWGTVINVGSVGLPFDGDQRACYYLFKFHDNGSIEVEEKRVYYRIEDTLAAFKTSGFEKEAGIVADLLRLELIYAKPFLVQFFRWAKASKSPLTRESLEVFLAVGKKF